MLRKLIIFIFVLLASTAIGLFVARSLVNAPSIKMNLSPEIANNSYTDLDVIKEINAKRLELNLSELQLSEKLNKAAKARLAVILTFDDYMGSESALTREKAMELAGFQTSMVGDIYFEINGKSNNFLLDLMNNPIERETISLAKFSEIGIAQKTIDNVTHYYLLFGNEIKKTSAKTVPSPTKSTPANWSGPELWEAVNSRRVEFGVGKLNKKDELCTIASIRLNQLLELNKLDGHAGFQPVLDRPDLKWISEKYNVSEYLAQGFSTPKETVSGWENTMGHKSLLTGGEYVWGCIYAQNGFAVAIAAY